MKEEEKTEEDSPEVSRRDPVKVKGIYVSGPVAGIGRMDELIDLVDRSSCTPYSAAASFAILPQPWQKQAQMVTR